MISINKVKINKTTIADCKTGDYVEIDNQLYLIPIIPKGILNENNISFNDTYLLKVGSSTLVRMNDSTPCLRIKDVSITYYEKDMTGSK